MKPDVRRPKRLLAWLSRDPTRSDSNLVAIVGDFNAYAQEDPVRFELLLPGLLHVQRAFASTKAARGRGFEKVSGPPAMTSGTNRITVRSSIVLGS